MLREAHSQLLLFPEETSRPVQDASSTTFVDNMKLPVHRWFRYSAGFSAQWVESILASERQSGAVAVFDPFAGAGTTLIAAEKLGMAVYGVEAHPFVARIARAKLWYRDDPNSYIDHAEKVRHLAPTISGRIEEYPALVRKCFTDDSLVFLDQLRRAWEKSDDQSAASQLVWLTLVAILRPVSHAGTAPWQYVLPRKTKRAPLHPLAAFEAMTATIAADMWSAGRIEGPAATFISSDARTCAGVPDGWANLVITSPPYANNYDYADATRLEMCFFREIDGWGDLQRTVRQHLIRSCSQHVPERAADLEEILAAPNSAPLRPEINRVCEQLAAVRIQKGGKKTYYLMVACYFLDLARVCARCVASVSDPRAFALSSATPHHMGFTSQSWNGSAASRLPPVSPRSNSRKPAIVTSSGKTASTACPSAKAACGFKGEPMAESAAHKWGQSIGDLLQLSLREELQKVADRHHLYLDY